MLLYQWHASRGARVVTYCPHLASAAALPWQAPSRQAGIRRDMPLAEATALADYARRDPPHLELHDPLADRQALETLAESCQRFSPSVGVEQCEHPESLLLDASGLGPLFGGELQLARRVVRELEHRNLVARAALADTFAAAWAVAHFADLQIADTSGAATTPNGSDGDADTPAVLAAIRTPCIVRPGETWPALARLNVAALRLPDELCALLADLGLRRVEQLAALDRSTLLARFGSLPLERLDQALGKAPEAIIAQAAPPECEFEWLFEYPTGRQEAIQFALEQLIAQACQALAQQRRGVLRLRCRFESEQRTRWQFVVGLFRPSADARHVGELTRLKLESMRFADPVAVVRLTVLAVDRLEYRQREIFVDEEHRREAPRELAVLVDRLSNRLGAQAVVRPWLLAGAQPEFACQYQPVARLAALPSRANRSAPARRPRRGSRGENASASGSQVPGDRPLHVRSHPLRLPVMSIAPEGPPLRFRLAGRDHRIMNVWGPERIETGWWRGRCTRRDYYQVETGTGARFWLFRELNSGGWFLHGEFV